MNDKRGYFGLGIYNFKHECNVGTLWRSALAFGASFIFTIGREYRRQASDTPNTTQNLPYFRYHSVQDCIDNLPKGCRMVCVEQAEQARPLNNFIHPTSAAYLLGNEVDGVPKSLLEKCLTVEIPTQSCINVGVAGSVVMYDRISKEKS